MSLEWQILLAVFLDWLIGDPRWLPHPVKFFGRFALYLEEPLRRIFADAKIAGIVTVLAVLGITAGVFGGLIFLAGIIHPALKDIVSVALIYSGIAARDMIRHSSAVVEALEAGSLPEARGSVAMICGRDTDRLDELEISRATIESVAENMVDGVTAPLFFAALGGPVGIMVYKAVNTLDSTFGYKNERYKDFGWASAKVDDLANFVPARITAVLVPVAAFILMLKPVSSWNVLWRDRLNHPSPNAGHTEAAVAGALGIQLGGLSYYFGRPSVKPTLGDAVTPIRACCIREANRLLIVTSGLALLLFLSARLAVEHIW